MTVNEDSGPSARRGDVRQPGPGESDQWVGFIVDPVGRSVCSHLTCYFLERRADLHAAVGRYGLSTVTVRGTTMGAREPPWAGRDTRGTSALRTFTIAVNL